MEASLMAERVPILCTDGTIISVQASSTHYCSPKSDEAFAYGAVEILIDKPNDPEGYNKTTKMESYCSADRLMRLIIKHGGIIGGQLPPLNFGNEHIVQAAQHKIATEGDAWWQARKAEKEEGVDESE
tara:strand:+ start:1229 stop:1612 length:384 start_codon:yes stop_codon:yes gene_type:complete